MTCSFNCARGYRVSGPSSARCGIGGAWSEDIHTVRCHGLYPILVFFFFVYYTETELNYVFLPIGMNVTNPEAEFPIVSSKAQHPIITQHKNI